MRTFPPLALRTANPYWGAEQGEQHRILLDNFPEMAPIVYTPTVGWACLNYHLLFRRPRGMYFSATDKGEMVRRYQAQTLVYIM